MNLAVFGIDAPPLCKGPATKERANLVRSGPPAPPLSLLARMETWLWQRRQRDLEGHLAGCVDVFALEARLRELERVPPHRRYE